MEDAIGGLVKGQWMVGEVNKVGEIKLKLFAPWFVSTRTNRLRRVADHVAAWVLLSTNQTNAEGVQTKLAMLQIRWVVEIRTKALV